MSVIGSNIIAGSSGTVETGYQISRSLRFNSADSAYLNRTPGSTTSRTTYTFAFWVKKTVNTTYGTVFCATDSSGSYTDSNLFLLYLDAANDKIDVGGAANGISTNAVFRDNSAHMHVVVAINTTLATAADRMKIYINGVQQTTSGTPFSQNQSTAVNWSSAAHNIGRRIISNDRYMNAYLSDFYFIDGQQLAASDFGQTDSATGVWVPKAYTGTYGTNGFWLKFDDNSGTTSTTLGKDSSGNSNNWTPNNFSVTAGVGNDSLVDSPTNYGTDTGAGGEVRGNYATLNPLSGLTTGTLSNGNLDLVGSTTTDSMRHSTIGIASGKWYTEITVNVASSSATMGLAVYGQSAVGTVNATPSRGYYHTGQKYSNGTLATYGNSFTNGDVIGIAVDVGAGKIWFSKNGTWQASGDPAAGTNAAYTDLSTTETWFLTVQTGSTGTAASCSWNFGQRPFAYTAPSGFKALCTQNLPTPAIGASASTLANKNFDIALWTGNGTSQTISGLNFQTDFLWLKRRSAAGDNGLFDVIRGGDKSLVSNSTSAEQTQTWTIGFNSTGYSLPTGDNFVNGSSITYVGWSWKANGAGSSNTAGSITSTVSANQTAGIAVITYTGTGTAGSFGHGLGVAPRMVIIKQRNSTWPWMVYHANLSANGYLLLSATDAVTTNSAVYSSAPSSSVVNIGNNATVNDNTSTYVAYCFAEIAGFSKFGSYTGNGSADGVFVYTGFRPRYVCVKRTNAASDWHAYDSARDPYNQSNNVLKPNSSVAEAQYAATQIDLLSNGFKFRGSDAGTNGNGDTFIYMAFGENPFNYSRAR